jgi:hypothetical protein
MSGRLMFSSPITFSFSSLPMLKTQWQKSFTHFTTRPATSWVHKGGQCGGWGTSVCHKGQLMWNCGFAWMSS